MKNDTRYSKVSIVTGVIGEDVHVTGIRILEHALRSVGYKVHSLGIHNTQEDFINAAKEKNADVIMISSLCGHAKILLNGFKEKCRDAGLNDTLLYLGGQLVIYSSEWKVVENKFLELGFDRVLEPFVMPDKVIGILKEDIKLKYSSFLPQ